MHLSDKMLIFSVLEQNIILTQQVLDKSNKTIEFRAGKADKNLTEERLMSYAAFKIITAIPYYSWANRGEGQMQVWIPRKITDVRLSSF